MKVLQQQRIVATGSAAGLPITVTASTFATVSASVAGLVSGLQQNEVFRVRILKTLLTCDDNSSIVVQNANLQCDSGKIIAPAFSGSPLGRASNAAFQGELNFQTRDIAEVGSVPASFAATLELLLQNTDSGDHQVTAFSITLELVRTQWDQPPYGDQLN